MSDWIEWNGGACPVDSNKVVKVEYKVGLVDEGVAGKFKWNCLGELSDIVAYRVL